MGCLLYAWWFGYSPFECEFQGNNIKIADCSVLRVLSNIPRKNKPNEDDCFFHNLSEQILEKDIRNRQFISSIIKRLSQFPSATELSDSI